MSKPVAAPTNKTMDKSAPPTPASALTNLHAQLGALKKRILDLTTIQNHKDYFTALLAGAEQTANLISTDRTLLEQIDFTQKSLAAINEAITTFSTKITWYRSKNISVSGNDNLEADARSEIIDQLQKQFLLTEAAIQKLKMAENNNASARLVLGIIKKRLDNLPTNLDYPVDPKLFPDVFVKKVKVIELHLSDINHDLAPQIRP